MPRRRALPPPHLPHPRLTSPTPRTPLTSHSRPTPYLPVALPAGGGRHPAGRRRLQVHPQVQARGAAQGPHGGQGTYYLLLLTTYYLLRTSWRPRCDPSPAVPPRATRRAQPATLRAQPAPPCIPGEQGGRRLTLTLTLTLTQTPTPGAQGGRREAEAAQAGRPASGGGGLCGKTAALRLRPLRPPARPASARSSSGRPPASASLRPMGR